MSVQGASQLHNRFKALLNVPGDVQQGWAKRAAGLISDRTPRRTGKTARSVRATRQGVTGSAVVTFLDRGTRAHTIEPRSRKVLKFKGRSGTVFARKARKPQMRGRNFVAPSGREAMDEVGTKAIRDRWNGAA